MPDPWNKAELVAECERLRERLLLQMDDEARERYRKIAEQYFMRARQGTKISAHSHSFSKLEARVLTPASDISIISSTPNVAEQLREALLKGRDIGSA
jgi:hypothetical protein